MTALENQVKETQATVRETLTNPLQPINSIVFKNGYMGIKVIATVGSNALLTRINDNSFIVVNLLRVDTVNNKCDWGFAYGYYESYDKAYEKFIETIVNPFLEYKEVI